MKVLLLSSTNNVKNGYGNITHELCSFLMGKVDFQLLLPESERANGPVSYPVSYVLPPYIFNVKTPKALQYLQSSFPGIEKFDVVHSLFEFPYALIAARLARKYRKPLIIGTQGTYAIQPLFWRPEKWLLKGAYNTAQVITAPSQFTKDAITRYAAPKPPVQIIHNGVHFERFQKPSDVGTIRTQYPGKKILLTVGGLKPRKGQDVVIRALGILKQQRSDFQYLIIGGGKLRGSLEKLAIKEGIGDHVTFLGEIDGDELVKCFQACYMYVHTPILVNWQFEGFGIVYLEASACRKPIVAADSGGITDAVIDGKTGLIVPENDPAATAEAISRLLDDEKLAATLGEEGWEYARQHDWSIIGGKFLNLYENLIGHER